MKKYTCLIIEDEYLLQEVLENYIGKVEELLLIGTFNNGLKANAYLKQNRVDLIFLDIKMPQLDGIEMLNGLVEKPNVIFTTAFDNYAQEAFDLDAVDYLLKPIKFDRFLRAINKFLSRNAPPSKGLEKDFIMVKTDYRLVKVSFSDLMFVQGDREYVKFYSIAAKVSSLLTLKSLTAVLPKSLFLRVHKSYFVSVKHIDMISDNTIYMGDHKIPIGLTYRTEVLEQLNTI